MGQHGAGECHGKAGEGKGATDKAGGRGLPGKEGYGRAGDEDAVDAAFRAVVYADEAKGKDGGDKGYGLAGHETEGDDEDGGFGDDEGQDGGKTLGELWRGKDAEQGVHEQMEDGWLEGEGSVELSPDDGGHGGLAIGVELEELVDPEQADVRPGEANDEGAEEDKGEGEKGSVVEWLGRGGRGWGRLSILRGHGACKVSRDGFLVGGAARVSLLEGSGVEPQVSSLRSGCQTCRHMGDSTPLQTLQCFSVFCMNSVRYCFQTVAWVWVPCPRVAAEVGMRRKRQSAIFFERRSAIPSSGGLM